MIRKLFSYLTIGALNTALGYIIIFGMMYGVGLDPIGSNVLGYSCCLVLSFILNKKFTFKSKHPLREELPRFLISFTISYSINLLTVYALFYFFDAYGWVSQLAGGFVYVLMFYYLSQVYVFQNKRKSRS